MGLFDRNNNKIIEKTYELNGYIVGVESKIIYHVSKTQVEPICTLPNGITGLTETAVSELRKLKPQRIIVPGSCKRFKCQFINFVDLQEIVLQEGVEEINCEFESKKAVNIKLPTTIKTIGKNNYPLDQHLVLPTGVIEIAPLFATHDTNLLSVTIPGTLKVLSTAAFNQCRNLQKVVLNEGVMTSSRDAFRGTNNLCALEIPSTYNGTLNLSMEQRSVSNVRGNSKYDGSNFEEELNKILKVKIKRGTKDFIFNIRKGEMPVIEISNNKIQIKCNGNQYPVLVDCNTLESGEYDVNGSTISKKQLSTNPQSGPSVDNYDEIFQKAIDSYLTNEDFEDEGFYDNDKDAIIKIMSELFMKQVLMGIIRPDANNINKIFNDAIRIYRQRKLDNDNQNEHHY